jgi:hypothetical protein
MDRLLRLYEAALRKRIATEEIKWRLRQCGFTEKDLRAINRRIARTVNLRRKSRNEKNNADGIGEASK